MKYLLLLFISLVIQGFSQESPSSSFLSAKTIISKNKISLNEDLTLKLTLQYPEDLHPDINLMKKRLLSYAGMQEPPFTLNAFHEYPPQKDRSSITQEFEFVLSPQRTGNHFLSLYSVPFNLASKEKQPVEIPAAIYTIEVYAPTISVDLKALIEPLMELSQDLPVAISQTNRNNYLKNPILISQEAEKNIAFLKSRRLPWLPSISAFICIGLIFLIRRLPSSRKTTARDDLNQKARVIEIKEELKKLSLTIPTNTSEMTMWMSQIDFLLRKYLEEKYRLPALSLTAQELCGITPSLAEISPELKRGMNEIFLCADSLKFAHVFPTAKECSNIRNTIERLSAN